MLLSAALAAAYGCMTSPHPRRAALADTRPASRLVIHLRDGRRHAGELLAVQDSALLVLLTSNRLAVAPLADVRRIDWYNYATSRALRGFETRVWTSPKLRLRARLASRFPFGLPAPALRSLLTGLRQASPDTLRPEAR